MTVSALALGAATTDISVNRETVASVYLTDHPGSKVVPSVPDLGILTRSNVPRWRGVTATVGDAYGKDQYWATEPQARAQPFVIENVVGDKAYVRALDTEVQPNAYVGGFCDVVQRDSGVTTTIRANAPITGGNFGVFHNLTDGTEYSTTNAYQHRRDGWWNPNFDYFYQVAAMDGAGNVGQWSAPVSYNPGGNNGTGAASNSTANLGSDWVEDGVLAAPTGLNVVANVAGGLLSDLTWNTVSGATGYVVRVAYQDPATIDPLGPHLVIGGTGAMAAGQIILAHKQITKPTVDMIGPRVWGVFEGRALFEQPAGGSIFSSYPLNTHPSIQYEFTKFGASENPAPTECGQHYIRIDSTAANGKQKIASANAHAGTAQDYYPTLEIGQDHQFTIWVRSNQATTLYCDHGFTSGGTEASLSVLGDGVWRRLTDVQAPDALDTALIPRRWNLSADLTSGLQLDVALVMWGRTDTKVGELDARQKAVNQHHKALRHHSLIKDNIRSSSDVDSLTAPYGTGPRYGESMFTHLENCAAEGNEPWIQIEWYFTTAQAQELFDFLFAPVSSGRPMALRRAALGRTEPYDQVFAKIYFEYGNECWNTPPDFRSAPGRRSDVLQMFQPSDQANILPAEAYGALYGRFADVWEADQYFPTGKLDWVIGGWAGRNDWNKDAARAFGRACIVTIANYLAGWDANGNKMVEDDASHQSILTAPVIYCLDNIESLVTGLKELADEPGSPFTYGVNLFPGIYEAGPGYNLDGLNGQSMDAADYLVQERMVKTRAAGTANLALVGYQAAAGYLFANDFVLGHGDTWTSHSTWFFGAQTFAWYQATEALGEETGGGECEVSEMIKRGETTVAGFDRDGNPATTGVLAAHQYRPVDIPGRVVITAANMGLGGHIKPRFLTDIRSATSCHVRPLKGEPREHSRWMPGKRPAGSPIVDGASQTGTTLAIGDTTWSPTVGTTFTIDGDATVYTVDGTTGYAAPHGSITITPALSASPADGAAITFAEVDADGYAPDPMCVDTIDMPVVNVSVPTDTTDFEVDDALGMDVAGIGPGQSVIVVLDGCEFGHSLTQAA